MLIQNSITDYVHMPITESLSVNVNKLNFSTRYGGILIIQIKYELFLFSSTE